MTAISKLCCGSLKRWSDWAFMALFEAAIGCGGNQSEAKPGLLTNVQENQFHQRTFALRTPT
jgi:hypothetical protein